MAFDPTPIHAMQIAQRVQALPQVGVFHGFVIGRFPSAFFPVVDPLGDTLAHVLAVGVNLHLATAFERCQGFNHCRELHAVVGGVHLTTKEFYLFAFAGQPGPPAAPPRVAFARPIGVNGDQGTGNLRCCFGCRKCAHSLPEICLRRCATTAGTACLRVLLAGARPTKRIPRTRFTTTSM